MRDQSRYIWIHDRRGTRLPFSNDVLASSLMVVGVEPETAYVTADAVVDVLTGQDRHELPVNELIQVVAANIDKHAGRKLAGRYSSWVAARRTQRPIVVLLGGAPGTGKSTVAGSVGSRLRVNAVMPTDAIREVMRQLTSPQLTPIIHASSFEAYRMLQSPLPDDHDPVVVGFLQQSEVVAAGVRALVNRALTEGSDVIVEGVHVVPGVFDADLEQWRQRAVVCQAVLAVPDEQDHRSHFLTRLERSPGRMPHRYLDAFAEVRRIQDHISLMAGRRSVPLLVMDHPDETIQRVVEMVVDAVIETGETRLAPAR